MPYADTIAISLKIVETDDKSNYKQQQQQQSIAIYSFSFSPLHNFFQILFPFLCPLNPIFCYIFLSNPYHNLDT